MEDRYAYLEKGDIIVAMVCDGHGGAKAAIETTKYLPQYLWKLMNETQGNAEAHAVEIRNLIMTFAARVDTQKTGTTLTGIIYKEGIVYIFNIGDSRTMMKLAPDTTVRFLRPIFAPDGNFMNKIIVDYKQTDFFLTTDHDPSSWDERTRVNNAGGFIAEDRLNGILSMTRAIGDRDIGPGISHIPDIYWVKAEKIDGPILMYSDGVYEPKRKSTKSVHFDDRYLYHVASMAGTENLVSYAYKEGSDDNITAMLVR